MTPESLAGPVPCCVPKLRRERRGENWTRRSEGWGSGQDELVQNVRDPRCWNGDSVLGLAVVSA